MRARKGRAWGKSDADGSELRVDLYLKEGDSVSYILYTSKRNWYMTFVGFIILVRGDFNGDS